jgi:hypothetical protein
VREGNRFLSQKSLFGFFKEHYSKKYGISGGLSRQWNSAESEDGPCRLCEQPLLTGTTKRQPKNDPLRQPNFDPSMIQT